MVRMLINGKPVTAEKGTAVLEIARAAGIEIPTLCQHESISPYGACRFCIVEVKQRGKTRYLTSCTLPVAEGLEIQTRSERVMKIRRILVELMLARCPESEVIRDLARQIGVGHCRFDRPQGDKSPCPTCGACTIVEQMRLQAAEAEKMPSTFVSKGGCILCGMCVRLCDDVMKVGALAFEGRGRRRRVTMPFREPSEFCTTCGACSFICPTGAIELMRIRARPPVPIPSEFDCGLSNRKPIYLPFPQAVPRVPIIDRNSLKLAHLLKEHSGAEIYNFYIDIRTPGKSMEEFYNRIAEEGVMMIRGQVADVYPEPNNGTQGRLVLQVEDTLMGRIRKIPVDMVVLAVGLEPHSDAQDVRRLFNMSCGSEGFFLERHPKLAPVSTFADGVFLAGCCQGPKDIPDTVAQAGAAACEALKLINHGHVELEPNTAFVLKEECSGAFNS